MTIPTYIINLKSRPERKANVLNQFEGKSEFLVTVVEAIYEKPGLLGLWKTMKHILKEFVKENDNLILICQDDHQFTVNYSYETLKQSIREAIKLDADILLGGVSWFQTAFQTSSLLFWTEKFSGLQFVIIFRNFFKPLLDLDLDGFDAGDYRISAFTDKKWFIYPYISTQADYGYSDVTLKNNKAERQNQLFKQSSNTTQSLLKISDFFRKRIAVLQSDQIDADTVTIPTFVINNTEQNHRLCNIKKQFLDRKEFDVSIIEVGTKPIGSIGLWSAVRQIVSTAIENDEDLLIICQSGHTFTEHYSKRTFIELVIKAHGLGADILLGEVSAGFSHILPITKELFWINFFHDSQFIVVYKKIFEDILQEPFDELVDPIKLLSKIAMNRVSLYPFISSNTELPNFHEGNFITPLNMPTSYYEQTQFRFRRVFKNFQTYREASNRVRLQAQKN